MIALSGGNSQPNSCVNGTAAVRRTINRWEETVVIPQAEWINGRGYLGQSESRTARPRARACSDAEKTNQISADYRGQPMNGEPSTDGTV